MIKKIQMLLVLLVIFIPKEIFCKDITIPMQKKFIVYKPEIKLDIVKQNWKDHGVNEYETVVEDGTYAEVTKIKATIVYPTSVTVKADGTPVTVEDFEGTITFTEEEGTKYYSELPMNKTLIADNKGSVEITIKSFSATTQRDTKPTFSTIKATASNCAQHSTNPIEIKQWVNNNDNGRVDWLEDMVDKLIGDFKNAGGEIGIVANSCTGVLNDRYITIDTYLVGAGEAIGQEVSFNQWVCSRTNIDGSVSKTVKHELRHTWQYSQTKIPGNNYDGDTYPMVVSLESAKRIEDYKENTLTPFYFRGDNYWDKTVLWVSNGRPDQGFKVKDRVQWYEIPIRVISNNPIFKVYIGLEQWSMVSSFSKEVLENYGYKGYILYSEERYYNGEFKFGDEEVAGEDVDKDGNYGLIPYNMAEITAIYTVDAYDRPTDHWTGVDSYWKDPIEVDARNFAGE